MKTSLFRLVLLLNFALPGSTVAQSLAGTWHGALASPKKPSVAIPTTITMRVAGTQLTGEVLMQRNGKIDKYSLQGTVQENQVAGTSTYPTDGTVFQFEAMLANEQLTTAFGQNGMAFMAGTFTKGGSGSTTQSGNPTKSGQAVSPTLLPAARLSRNVRLVGAWAHSSAYSSNDFHASTRTLLYLFPDGRLGSGGGAANASYDGSEGAVSGQSGANGIDVVPGVVWYNKGDQIWLHATQKKVPDEVWGRFVMTSDGRAMHLYRGNNRTLYERTN